MREKPPVSLPHQVTGSKFLEARTAAALFTNRGWEKANSFSTRFTQQNCLVELTEH